MAMILFPRKAKPKAASKAAPKKRSPSKDPGRDRNHDGTPSRKFASKSRRMA